MDREAQPAPGGRQKHWLGRSSSWLTGMSVSIRKEAGQFVTTLIRTCEWFLFALRKLK